MISIIPFGEYLAVKFPYGRLDQFREMLDKDERYWDKKRGVWLIAGNAFDAVADAWGADFEPLSYDVLCIAYPTVQPKPMQSAHEWNAKRHEQLRRAKYAREAA
jgi:hypothetical protein